VEHGKQNAPSTFILRGELEESGEKEDLKATGESAVEEAMVALGRGDGGGRRSGAAGQA
jgi:hypothetical protein